MAIPATELDPVLAARAAASPRVFMRGEEIFASGAVLDFKETGPGVARARVQGSSPRPYDVKLRFGDVGFASRCTCPFDWEPVCKHAVASALALRAPAIEVLPSQGSGEAIAKARAREIEARQKSAKAESFRIVAEPRGGRAHFTLLSPRTQATYEVFVSREASYCTCADFVSSELGPCKHILYVAREAKVAPLRAPIVFVQSTNTEGKVYEHLGDIRTAFPAGRPPAAFSALLDQDGFIDPTRRSLKGLSPEAAAARIEGLLASLPEGTRVRPEVKGVLAAIRARAARRSRMETLAAAVRNSLAGKGDAPEAWRKSVGAMSYRLHPYQIDGVLFAATAGRALMADDMGLGKTLQALATARLLSELGDVRRTLVVCPASLKHQWAREAKKALGPDFPAVVVEGSRKTRARAYASPDNKVLIVNYEVLIRDIREVRAARFDLVVLDEAQRIKNWNTRTAKTVKSVQTPFALVLTGTPLENRLSELHSIAEYLDLRTLGPAWRLVPEFGRLDDKGKIVGFTGLSLIRRRLAPCFIRRERSLVLSQLPPRSEKTYTVKFTSEQRGPHDDSMQKAARILAKKYLTEADVLRVMSFLTSARMLANGKALYEFAKIEDDVRRGQWTELMARAYPSPKLAEFAQVVEDFLEERGCKLVVFSQWERMLRLAAAAARPSLESAGARPIFFHGQLSSRERAEAIADFHDDPRARVFFSTDAGSVGLNLQEAASVVVHLEVPWNPAVLDQRVGRLHRMGQTKPVRVVNLVSEGSIEERIALTVKNKRELFNGLFRGTSEDVTFGDGSGASGLRERLQTLIVENLGELRQPVDKEVPVVLPVIPPEIVEAPVESAPSDVPPTATATTGVGAFFDAAPILGGLLGLFAPGIAAMVPKALPLTVSREGGRVRIEIPDVSATAWEKLAAFAQTMATRTPA